MALGMSVFPSFMTQATPATQPLINAEPAVAAQAEQNPQVGQVMPGVQGADAPVVAQNGPSRDVKLTLRKLRRRRAAWCYVALTRTAALSLVCAAMKW